MRPTFTKASREAAATPDVDRLTADELADEIAVVDPGEVEEPGGDEPDADENPGATGRPVSGVGGEQRRAS